MTARLTWVVWAAFAFGLVGALTSAKRWARVLAYLMVAGLMAWCLVFGSRL